MRTRPRPLVGSSLEYGCHVRDVFRIFERRLHRMLAEDNPLLENWEQDETAVADRYWAQVAWPRGAAAERIVSSFAADEGDAWQRAGRCSDGAVFTVETLARYFIHDLRRPLNRGGHAHRARSNAGCVLYTQLHNPQSNAVYPAPRLPAER